MSDGQETDLLTLVSDLRKINYEVEVAKIAVGDDYRAGLAVKKKADTLTMSRIRDFVLSNLSVASSSEAIKETGLNMDDERHFKLLTILGLVMAGDPRQFEKSLRNVGEAHGHMKGDREAIPLTADGFRLLREHMTEAQERRPPQPKVIDVEHSPSRGVLPLNPPVADGEPKP